MSWFFCKDECVNLDFVMSVYSDDFSDDHYSIKFRYRDSEFSRWNYTAAKDRDLVFKQIQDILKTGGKQ